MLGQQLLGNAELVLAATERYKAQRLVALHQRAEQAADGQRSRAVHAQGSAGLGTVQQVDQRPVDGGLAGRLGQRLVGQDLALQQGADRHLAGVQLGEGGDLAGAGLLQHDRQAVAFGLADGDLAALGQGLAGAGLQLGLGAVGLHQPQHQLEILAHLAQRHDLGLCGFAGGHQAGLRLRQAQQFAGHACLQGLGADRGLCAETIDFSHDCIQPVEPALLAARRRV